MLRVTAYTGGHTVASARFRVRQYIGPLQRLGIDLAEVPARFGSFPPRTRALRPAWGMLSVAERFRAVMAHRDTDVTLLQREMLSTLATVERFTKPPRILDVDDAIWLWRRGRSAVSLARLCDAVVCGNSFIADFFRQHAPRVVILPTAVDTDRFCPSAGERDPRVICWSGSSSGFRFLDTIDGALCAVLKADPRRRLRIVSDRRPSFRSIPERQVDYVRWSEAIEVAAVQDAGVAIMPLDDSSWSRGKCSYKLLTYMACAVPTIATPVGMNAEVLAKGDFGVAARTQDEWVDAANYILNNPEPARAMGAKGREIVLRDYSLRALAPQLASVLHGTSC